MKDFLDTMLADKEVPRLAKNASSFNPFFHYWKSNLFERVMRLFVWECYPVQPKEIEGRLILAGHCGVADFEGELTAFFGSFFGVTKYLDEWTSYNIRCPIYSGSRTIGENIAIINNNSTRMPVLPLIHHYAILLAHAEVTLLNTLINARDAGGVPVATTEKQKMSIEQYLNDIYIGKYGVVTDIGNIGLEYAGSDRKTAQPLVDVYTVREKILKSFYADLGVRAAMEKRSNAITAEVEADTSMLLLNLADMLDSRQRGAEAVNELYGTNWSVRLAEEIDYAEDMGEESDNDTSI